MPGASACLVDAMVDEGTDVTAVRRAHALQRIGARLRHLRLQPFDTTTAAGRADERQRRAALSSAAAMVAKLLSITAQFITVPLALGYLGAERFGMWVTLSSLLAMLAFADLGIGNGLLNAVSEASGRDDSAAIRRHVASAIAMLGVVAAVLLLGFAAAYPLVHWSRVFNVSSGHAIAEAGPAAAVLLLCVAVNIPATIMQRLQLALQMGFVANLWQAAGSVMALIAVLCVVHVQSGLAGLLLAFAGAPILAAALNALWFFGRMRPDLRPRAAEVSLAEGRRLLHSGALFLVLQIVVSVTYLSDAFVIARVLGAGSVTTYAVPEKLFSVIPMVLTVFMLPLWPAYAEALARGDRAWVGQILRRTLVFAAGFALLAATTLYFAAPSLLRLWTGRELQVPVLLLAGFAVWKIVEALGSTTAVYLNGNNLIREQLAMSLATAVVAIGLKLWLVGRIGVAGAIWATIVAYLICTVPPMIVIVRRSLSRQVRAHA